MTTSLESRRLCQIRQDATKISPIIKAIFRKGRTANVLP